MVAAISPARPLVRTLYRCDKRFHVDVLQSMREDDAPVLGIAYVSGEDLLVFRVEGSKVVRLDRASIARISATRRGGSSSNRYQNIRENQVLQFQKKIVDILQDCFFDFDTGAPTVHKWLLCGNGPMFKTLKVPKRLVSNLLGTRPVARALSPADCRATYDRLRPVLTQRPGLQGELEGLLRGGLLAYGQEEVLQLAGAQLLKRVYLTPKRKELLTRDKKLTTLTNSAAEVSVASCQLLRDFGGMVAETFYRL